MKKINLIVGIILMLSLVSAFAISNEVLNYKIIDGIAEVLNTKEVSLLDRSKLDSRVFLEEQMYKDLVEQGCYTFSFVKGERIIEIGKDELICVSKEEIDLYAPDYLKTEYEKEIISIRK